MINPVIYTFHIFGYDLVLRWYGVLVMFGVMVGTWLTEKEINRRGGNGESIWDALLWVLIPAIIGARLWYVINATLGGNKYYMENPLQIINIPQGGLHFFGGLLFGALALYLYLRQQKGDIWLFLDAIGPAALIGQALARPANYINQELYGPPTKLPWGISIQAGTRLPQYADLSQFPVASTRFHPTFAYEMVLNILAGLFLLWYSRQYEERMKPGAVFGAWLVFAGSIRTFIEFFRPDQPRFTGTFITYSMIFAFLMAVGGVLLLLARYGKLPFAKGWEDDYQISQPENVMVAVSLKGSSPQTRTKARRAASVKPGRKPAEKMKVKAAAKPKPKARSSASSKTKKQ